MGTVGGAYFPEGELVGLKLCGGGLCGRDFWGMILPHGGRTARAQPDESAATKAVPGRRLYATAKGPPNVVTNSEQTEMPTTSGKLAAPSSNKCSSSPLHIQGSKPKQRAGQSAPPGAPPSQTLGGVHKSPENFRKKNKQNNPPCPTTNHPTHPPHE